MRPVVGDSEEREEVEESVVLVAQDTRCSPRRTGPAILAKVRPWLYWSLIVQACVKDAPSIPIKFPTLVHAEYEVHMLAGPICLVQNSFVVLLSCPEPLLDAEVQIELSTG